MADLDADSPWGAPSASSMLAPSYADEGAALGGPEPSADDESEIDAGQLVRKEELVKEILARQDGLRALLDRVCSVQAEGAKLRSDNQTLQTYIDNLTRTNAMAAGAKR